MQPIRRLFIDFTISATVFVSAGILAAAAIFTAGVADARDADPIPMACAAPTVVGAQFQIAACLDDLTTAGTVVSGHTNPADFAGLNSTVARNPSGVPGMQIDGYFPDESTFNTLHGWNHDSQFVIRLPANWNGGLVVSGAPGTRRQYAQDFTISDWVLAQGYAYASTDKGNNGATFYLDGAAPGDALVEWNYRVTQLTIAAQATVAQQYGRPAARTYMAGLSNGGYLVRWQLENVPWLYDGGIDWEGNLFQADGPNMLTYLPPALRNYPNIASDSNARQSIVTAGFAPESEPLWEYHDKIYWDLSQRTYRAEFDPAFSSSPEGTPFCASGTPECDADYDYATRAATVHDAMRKVSLTGRIQRPLITFHGTLDTLLPISQDSDFYAGMIRDQGREGMHRYYRIEGGNHVDALYDQHPELLRPLLPCFHSAFTLLESWASARQLPPPSATIPRPSEGDIGNTCALQS